MEGTTRRWSSTNKGPQMENKNTRSEMKVKKKTLRGPQMELRRTSGGGGWRAAGGRELGFLIGEIGKNVSGARVEEMWGRVKIFLNMYIKYNLIKI